MQYKLSMKLLAGTEAVFFLSLIMAFVYLVYFTPQLEMTQLLELKSMSVFSMLLFSSSGTYWLAEHYYKKGKRFNVKIFLAITILLGSIFLFGEGKEYYGLIEKKIYMSHGTFGTGFYGLTGFHALHVLGGLVMLSVLLWRFFKGDFNNKDSAALPAAGIYWHFVDVVWFFVFAVVYVIPRLL